MQFRPCWTNCFYLHSPALTRSPRICAISCSCCSCATTTSLALSISSARALFSACEAKKTNWNCRIADGLMQAGVLDEAPEHLQRPRLVQRLGEGV